MSQLIRLTKILRDKSRTRVSVSFRGHNSTRFPMKSSVQKIWFEDCDCRSMRNLGSKNKRFWSLNLGLCHFDT